MSINRLTANFTESAGVPLTPYPDKPHFKSIFSASNGCEIVIACPAPLCSDLGATTVVLPISDIASHKALMPLEKILSSLTIRIVGVNIMIKNQLNLKS